MKKPPLIDDILLGSVWLFWTGALFFFIKGHPRYCLITGVLALSGGMFYFFNIRMGFFYMFGRKQTESGSAQIVPAPEPLSAMPREERKPATATECTVIARNTLFTGNIDMDGDIQIHGDVRGNVHVREGIIRVMPAGRVEGELCAPEIIIDGTVEGTCEAKSIDILEHGVLQGALRSISLSIRHGGVFIGQSEKLQQEDAPTRIVAFKSLGDDDETLPASTEDETERQCLTSAV